MNFGRRILVGAGIGGMAMVAVAAVTYIAAPPIVLPQGLAWLEVYGRIGISAATGFAAFFVCWFLTVLSLVASIGSDFE